MSQKLPVPITYDQMFLAAIVEQLEISNQHCEHLAKQLESFQAEGSSALNLVAKAILKIAPKASPG